MAQRTFYYRHIEFELVPRGFEIKIYNLEDSKIPVFSSDANRPLETWGIAHTAFEVKRVEDTVLGISMSISYLPENARKFRCEPSYTIKLLADMREDGCIRYMTGSVENNVKFQSLITDHLHISTSKGIGGVLKLCGAGIKVGLRSNNGHGTFEFTGRNMPGNVIVSQIEGGLDFEVDVSYRRIISQRARDLLNLGRRDVKEVRF
jgi:hypothetical protein